MHLLFWLIEGMAVGWLSQFSRRYRRNRVMALVMGTAGAVAGGLLVVVSSSFAPGEIIFSNLGAVLGAAVLIFLFRYVGATREYDAIILPRTFRMNRSSSPHVARFAPLRRVAYARSRNEVM